MKRLVLFLTGLSLTTLAGLAAAAPPSAATASVGSAGVVRYIEQGQPPVVIHLTVEQAQSRRKARGSHGKPGGGGSTGNNLYYHGGTGGIGVETAPKIYLVFWGSQWVNNDRARSRDSGILSQQHRRQFLAQHRDPVLPGRSQRHGILQWRRHPAGNQAGMLYGYWYDSGSAAPNRPKQSQLAAEAVRAAQYFGNTTAGSNNTTQYVIATAHGYNASGFGTQYCAWHSSTSSTYATLLIPICRTLPMRVRAAGRTSTAWVRTPASPSSKAMRRQRP